MSLEYYAARWLKWDKGCKLVLFERSPRSWHCGQPDVLGVTAARFLLEIEIKRSVSDFRANAKKLHVINRFSSTPEIAERFHRKAPKQFWFLVPPPLVEKVRGQLPEYAGLMTLDERGCVVVKPSPVNQLSEKLTLKECATLMNNAGNQMVAMMSEVASRRMHGTADPHFMDDYYYNDLPKWSQTPYEYSNYQI